jgi:hypothetical protein
MSAIRRLAMRISAAVVRWASPGCKDWAEGLEREVEFVKGDWAALGWAIGSLRLVLYRRMRPAGARRDAPPRSPMWWIFPFFEASQILINAVAALRASNWYDRIASGLIAFGWMCWAVFSVANWLWKRNEPPISDIRAYWLFSRATLERRLKGYRSLRRWLPLMVPVTICTGLVMSLRGAGEVGAISTGFVVAVGAIALWLLCLDTPREDSGTTGACE